MEAGLIKNNCWNGSGID